MKQLKLSKLPVFTLAFLLVIFLSGCGGILEISLDITPTPPPGAQSTLAALQTQVATLQPSLPLLGVTSDSETIRRRMLSSHELWSRMWVDGVVSQYAGEEQSMATHIQVWMDHQNGRFRLLSGVWEGGSPNLLQVSDGQHLAQVTFPDGERQDGSLPEEARLPYSAPDMVSGTILPHPLGRILLTPGNEALFPTALAQRGGEFRPVEMATQAGREVLVVDWFHDSQRGDRFWLDVETGVALRWQSFNKGGSDLGMEVIINQVAYDPDMPDELFTTRVGEAPRFALDASGRPVSAAEPPPAVFEPGASELYFVVNGLGSGGSLRLARLPARCALDQEPCPLPQVVEGYPNLDGYIEPLVWSPDGSSAAVMIYDNERSKAVLWRYTPMGEDWTSLAEFTTISYPLIWSPDGQWLAFTAMSGGEVEDLWVVRVDGSSLENLTGGQFPAPDYHARALAWLDGERVSFWVLNRRSAEVFVDRKGGKEAEKLNEFELPNGIGAFSPDRQTLAFGTQNDQEGAVLSVSAQDGSGSKRIASFQRASIQQILWTPDGGWILFSTLTSSATGDDLVTTVYTIRADGTDLRQLYQAGSVTNMTASPDSRYVLVENSDTNRLVMASIEGGPAYPLEIPGQRLDEPVRGASWRQ